MTQPPTDEVTHLAYAEAVVMLMECLLLKLVERKVLSLEEIIETIETTIDSKRHLVQANLHPEIATVAAGVLARIANSVAASRGSRPEAH
jgi:hypothetical protein